jgi:hypothetical protein
MVEHLPSMHGDLGFMPVLLLRKGSLTWVYQTFRSKEK